MYLKQVALRKFIGRLTSCLVLAFPATLLAEPLRIAVSSNFKTTLEILLDGFTGSPEDGFRVSAGATGALYAQLVNGAPFDIFFAADNESARKLLEKNRAIPGSLKTYAIGQLVMAYNRQKSDFDTDICDIREQKKPGNILASMQMIAIANPDTAPYGKAALQVLAKKGLVIEGTKTRPRILRGKNVMQAEQFLVTGHVDAAFISLSQAKRQPMEKFAFCIINPASYQPIYQTMATIENNQRSTSNKLMIDRLYTYLDSPEAQRIILDQGFQLPSIIAPDSFEQ